MTVCFSACIFYLGINMLLIFSYYCIIEQIVKKLCQEAGHKAYCIPSPGMIFDSFHRQVLQTA